MTQPLPGGARAKTWRPDSQVPALSLDHVDTCGLSRIVQWLLWIKSCGMCFQILTNRFRQAFLLRLLDFYLVGLYLWFVFVL